MRGPLVKHLTAVLPSYVMRPLRETNGTYESECPEGGFHKRRFMAVITHGAGTRDIYYACRRCLQHWKETSDPFLESGIVVGDNSVSSEWSDHGGPNG